MSKTNKKSTEKETVLSQEEIEKALNSEQADNDNIHSQDISSDALSYLEMAQRLKAEFDNYKKRNKDVAETSFNDGVAYAVNKLLPVIDNVNQAKSKITDTSVLEGLDIISNQIINSLKAIGVEKIDCQGKPFDPNYHNAVMVENDKEKEDNIVLQELQEGFVLKNKVIRHSVVKINKHN